MVVSTDRNQVDQMLAITHQDICSVENWNCLGNRQVVLGRDLIPEIFGITEPCKFLAFAGTASLRFVLAHALHVQKSSFLPQFFQVEGFLLGICSTEILRGACD